MKREVISLYDKTGFSLEPWVTDGYAAFCYDIANPDPCESRNGILFIKADLHDPGTLKNLAKRHKGWVAFLMRSQYVPTYAWGVPCTGRERGKKTLCFKKGQLGM
jgi:hypothetical protein